MDVKNFLKPGQYAVLVPVGLDIVLQYSEGGRLQKVYNVVNSTRVDITDKIIDTLVENRTMPIKIHITGGTTWVSGVLYTSQNFSVAGTMPMCIQDALLDHYVEDPYYYNFYGYKLESTMFPASNVQIMQQQLKIARIKMLSGWLVPSVVTGNTINDWINSPQFTFKRPLVSKVVVYHNSSVEEYGLTYEQIIVSGIEQIVDDNGYIRCKILVDDKVYTTKDISDVYRFNIQKGATVILDNGVPILCYYDSKKLPKPYKQSMTCKSCGKKITIPEEGETICANYQCSSRLLGRIPLFLKSLELPSIEKSQLIEWIERGTITCLPDILDLEGYKESDIKITLGTLLRSIVPIDVVRARKLFDVIANNCNNNVTTFMYYMTNPETISKELKIEHNELPKLVSWLSDYPNLLDIQAMLQLPNVTVMNADTRFEGLPLLRNELIYITGKFVHGSTENIIDILNSYSGRVTTTFSSDVTTMIIGDTKENVDGLAINSASQTDIKKYTESEFFNHYGIDDDLKNNLV